MKTTLKIFAIINIVLGGLCILGAMIDNSLEAMTVVIGGGWWLTNGIIMCVYLNKNKTSEK